MTKSLLQSVAPVVSALRVDLDLLQFVLGGYVEAEGLGELGLDDYLEDQDNNDGREGGHPEEGFEAAGVL
jgi:hypothetical protein